MSYLGFGVHVPMDTVSPIGVSSQTVLPLPFDSPYCTTTIVVLIIRSVINCPPPLTNRFRAYLKCECLENKFQLEIFEVVSGDLPVFSVGVCEVLSELGSNTKSLVYFTSSNRYG